MARRNLGQFDGDPQTVLEDKVNTFLFLWPLMTIMTKLVLMEYFPYNVVMKSLVYATVFACF